MTLLQLKKLTIQQVLKSIFLVIIPGVVVVTTHAFWLLPTILSGSNPIEDLGQAFSTVNAVRYFSFASFENTISLLHPNWPENIFGKVSFMRSEFLLIPFIAFSGLLLIDRSEKNELTKRHIIFFAFLSLVGTFLAKGAQEPFGNLYLWLFNNMPGFQMFRDPTKWYVLVLISYTFLIPFSLKLFANFTNEQKKIKISNKIKTFIPYLVFSVFIFFWIFTIREGITGSLTGTFQKTEVPDEYNAFADFIEAQPDFFRILWVPSIQRFGYVSDQHPAVNANIYFDSTSLQDIVRKFHDSDTQARMQHAGVKYVVIPYDSEREIFLEDRKYDERIRLDLKRELDTIPWLSPTKHFQKLAVYEISASKNHLYFEKVAVEKRLQLVRIDPTHYKADITGGKKGDRIIFSESFDTDWRAIINPDTILQSNKYGGYNSFILPNDGDYSLDIVHVQQRILELGIIISITFFIIISIMLLFLFYKVYLSGLSRKNS